MKTLSPKRTTKTNIRVETINIIIKSQRIDKKIKLDIIHREIKVETIDNIIKIDIILSRIHLYLGNVRPKSIDFHNSTSTMNLDQKCRIYNQQI